MILHSFALERISGSSLPSPGIALVEPSHDSRATRTSGSRRSLNWRERRSSSFVRQLGIAASRGRIVKGGAVIRNRGAAAHRPAHQFEDFASKEDRSKPSCMPRRAPPTGRRGFAPPSPWVAPARRKKSPKRCCGSPRRAPPTSPTRSSRSPAEGSALALSGGDLEPAWRHDATADRPIRWRARWDSNPRSQPRQGSHLFHGARIRNQDERPICTLKHPRALRLSDASSILPAVYV